MKNIVIMLIVVLLGAPFVRGQRKYSLNIGGVEMWLGMPEAQAIAALRANSNTVDESGVVAGPPYGMLGQVSALNGKVSRISKEWLLNQTANTHVGFASAFYGAVSSMTSGIQQNCNVTTGFQKEPTFETQDIFITCPMDAVVRSLRISNFQTNAEVQELLETREQWVKEAQVQSRH